MIHMANSTRGSSLIIMIMMTMVMMMMMIMIMIIMMIMKLHFTDFCIMPTRLPGHDDCPKKNDGQLGEKCVSKYLTEKDCKSQGGKWTRFITNVIEKTAGVLSTCHQIGDMQLKKGVPYEPHKVSQGADELEQYVLIQKPPDVVYAPPTYVNHNGVTTEGKFSSYKWKVPCFPSNVTQRCVLRIR